MSDVIFEDNSPMLDLDPVTEESPSKIIQAVIWLGLAQDRHGAIMPLAALALLAAVIAAVVFFYSVQNTPPESPYLPGQNALFPPMGIHH